MNIFDKLTKKLSLKSAARLANGATNPLDHEGENEFLTSMSKHALKLYERKCDIKKFTKILLSEPDDTSYNEKIEELFKEGFVDPLDDKLISELADNKDLWDDLDL